MKRKYAVQSIEKSPKCYVCLLQIEESWEITDHLVNKFEPFAYLVYVKFRLNDGVPLLGTAEIKGYDKEDNLYRGVTNTMYFELREILAFLLNIKKEA